MKKLILLLVIGVNLLIAQGDCPGQYRCLGGNLTAVVDVVDELNAGNAGCLASNEGTTSYWIKTCALTAGTIQFTIAPQGNNNDYDWAVYDGTTCPPIVNPIRCSYALSVAGPGGDNTGVNSANNFPQVDNSEGVFGNEWTQDINAVAGQCFLISINNYGAGSNNFTFTFGGTAILDCAPLPVEMLSFKGWELAPHENMIEWSTASEFNCSHFELEYSIDAITWKYLDNIQGSGNSNEEVSYNYLHITDASLTYYRLQQVDFDGNVKIYGPISIDKTLPTIVSRTIYNYSGQTILDLYNAPSGMYTLYLFYSDGTYEVKKIIR